MTQRAVVPDCSEKKAGTARAGRAWLRGLTLLAISGVLLTLSFPGYACWPLAFVALAPFVVCVIRRPANWKWMGTYYLFGVLWFLGNLHWLWPLTDWGTVALCLYLGLFWLLFAWALRRLIVELRWPALVAVPLVWVATEYLRSTLLTGFPWFLLGNALAVKVVFIQIADLLGVWGVSFFAAGASGLIVDVLRLPLWRAGRVSAAILRLTGTAVVTSAAVVGYGLFRLGQHTQTAGPTVAVIQDYIPESIKNHPTDKDKDEIFAGNCRGSQAALAASGPGKVDLIVWPETIVPEPINTAWRNIEENSARWGVEMSQAWLAQWRPSIARAKQYDQTLAALARENNTWMVVGSPGEGPETRDRWLEQNLAILYSPREGQVLSYYAKRHLVPFGELVPFRESWPWLHRMLLGLTPMKNDYTLDAGREWTRFAVTTAQGATYHFGVPICYEDVMPYPSQAFTRPENGKKGVDFLATITNDGWYESRHELLQHLQMDQLRAVENRVPVLRSVNGGCSGFVDSNGRVVKLVENGGKTPMDTGWATNTLLLDSRISLYSRIGDLFPMLCGAAAVLAVGWTILRPRQGGSKGGAVIVESKPRERR